MPSTRKRDFSREQENSRDTSNCTNNERIPRALGNLPTTRGSAFSINVDCSTQHFIQSPIYENVEYNREGVNSTSSTVGNTDTSDSQPERRIRTERTRANHLAANNEDESVHIHPPTSNAAGMTTGSSDTSNPQSERPSRANRTRVHYFTADNDDESPPTLPPTRGASRFPVDGDGVSGSQSERRTTASRLRTHYSIVNNGAEVPQILPPPPGRISELFSRVLENAVINESQSEIESWNDRLRELRSADDNIDGRPRNRKFSKLEIASKVIFVLTLIFIVICCVARFTEQKTTSSISVTLVSLFLAIGCFTLYVLLGFFAICTIPFRNEPLDFNF